MAIWAACCGDSAGLIGEFFVEMSVFEGLAPVFAHGNELDFEWGSAPSMRTVIPSRRESACCGAFWRSWSHRGRPRPRYHRGYPDQSARAADRALAYSRQLGHAHTLAFACRRRRRWRNRGRRPRPCRPTKTAAGIDDL